MTESSQEPVTVLQGDITRVPANAIVNAANKGLAMGGGVCGAIFKAAGVDELSEACRQIGKCPTGSAVITPAFRIDTARYIVHAVGPVYTSHPPDEARQLLRSAYSSAIRLAADNGCKSIAFPAISTGIYGYPLEEACREAVDICREEAEATGLTVMLVGFDEETVNCLERHLTAGS